jgi:hypothetical protein
MSTQNKSNLHHISIEELSGSAVAEIREDLSDSELNSITGGMTALNLIDLNPIITSGCDACCSGYDPRFEEKMATY